MNSSENIINNYKKTFPKPFIVLHKLIFHQIKFLYVLVFSNLIVVDVSHCSPNCHYGPI